MNEIWQRLNENDLRILAMHRTAEQVAHLLMVEVTEVNQYYSKVFGVDYQTFKQQTPVTKLTVSERRRLSRLSGLKMRQGKLRPEQELGKDDLVDWFMSGVSLSQIAKQMGVSTQTIHRRCKELGTTVDEVRQAARDKRNSQYRNSHSSDYAGRKGITLAQTIIRKSRGI